MAGPAIAVENLCKQYGSVLAVDGVSFEIAPGELVGFLGQNGAGKTTTMRILTTFMPASSGRASVAGHDVMYESMGVRNNLGYLQESVPLYPDMRVEEYLSYRAKLKKVERTGRTARVDYCIERSASRASASGCSARSRRASRREVRLHQVGRELDAVEHARQGLRDCLTEQRLADARHVLKQ